MLSTGLQRPYIHYVNEFLNKLHAVLEAEPFRGNQRALALKAGLDRAQLHRVLHEKREPSPRLVGRIASALGKAEAAALIKCYLQGVAAEVTQEQLTRRAHGKSSSPKVSLA